MARNNDKHPQAGHPVKIAKGPLKDKYYVVHDWLVNQFQGKTIESMRANSSIARYMEPVARRKFPVDEKLVWGRLYPTMEWCCVHDDELRTDAQPEMQVIEGGGEKVELPPNVEPLSKKRKPKVVKPKKEKPDDTGTAS